MGSRNNRHGTVYMTLTDMLKQPFIPMYKTVEAHYAAEAKYIEHTDTPALKGKESHVSFLRKWCIFADGVTASIGALSVPIIPVMYATGDYEHAQQALVALLAMTAGRGVFNSLNTFMAEYYTKKINE